MAAAHKTSAGHPSGSFKDGNIAQAWLVLLLALCFGAVLAAVQVNYSEVIEANKRNETLKRVPELIWGKGLALSMTGGDGAVNISPGAITIEKGPTSSTYAFYRVTRENELAGWVVKAGGKGYADDIELLIGLDPGVEMITGLFVLESDVANVEARVIRELHAAGPFESFRSTL